jgi:hypothetical protein
LGVGKSKEQGAGSRGGGKKAGSTGQKRTVTSCALRVLKFALNYLPLATYALRFIELQHGSTYC